MEVFHKLQDVVLAGRRTSVAIGNFDGLHLGHAALLGSMLEHARRTQSVPAVLTFYPHPVEVLRPAQPLERLTTASEKLTLLERAGVELVLVAKFDSQLASLTPSQFFENYLANGLGARSVHVGFNFCFGKSRAGDTQVLGELCASRGIVLQVQTAVQLGGTKVSSSAIRKLVAEGNVTEAARLLGRHYSINGLVQPGDGRGHQLGFPTANLHCSAEKQLPKNGVYVTQAIWQKQSFRSVCNVGVRPTFQTTGAPASRSVEVHVLDFNSRLYDEFIELQFCERIRDEKKFESVDALKKQIAADVETARNFTP